MALMSWFQLALTEPSSYGSQRIPRETSVSRQLLDMIVHCSTWCIWTKSSFSSLRARMAPCVFGESTKPGSYCSIHGSWSFKQYKSSLQLDQASSQTSGWHVLIASKVNLCRSSRGTLKALCTSLRRLRLGERKRTAFSDCSWSKIWFIESVSFKFFSSCKKISFSLLATIRPWNGSKQLNEKELPITNLAIQTRQYSRACVGITKSRSCMLPMRKATSL